MGEKVIDMETGEIIQKEYTISEINALADGIIDLDREIKRAKAAIDAEYAKIEARYDDEIKQMESNGEKIKKLREELLVALAASKMKSWKTEKATASRVSQKSFYVADQEKVFKDLKKKKLFSTYVETKNVFKPEWRAALKSDEAAKISGIGIRETEYITVRETVKSVDKQ